MTVIRIKCITKIKKRMYVCGLSTETTFQSAKQYMNLFLGFTEALDRSSHRWSGAEIPSNTLILCHKRIFSKKKKKTYLRIGLNNLRK